jgi:hypothetical protein
MCCDLSKRTFLKNTSDELRGVGSSVKNVCHSAGQEIR